MKISWNNVKRFLAGASIALVLGGCSPKQMTQEPIVSTFIEELQTTEEQSKVVDFFETEEVKPVTEEMREILKSKDVPLEYLNIPYISNLLQEAIDCGQTERINYSTYNNHNTLQILLDGNEDRNGVVYSVGYDGSTIHIRKAVYPKGIKIEGMMDTFASVGYKTLDYPYESFDAMSFRETVFGKEKTGYKLSLGNDTYYMAIDTEKFFHGYYDQNVPDVYEDKINEEEYMSIKKEAYQKRLDHSKKTH